MIDLRTPMIKILFIDDEWNSHETMRKILPPEFSLISAVRGSAGCQILRSEVPDIVLLDHFLPDMNGMDVLRNIISVPAAPPVIMLTCNADIRNIVKAMQIGAFDYFVKPFDLNQLLQSLKKALISKFPRYPEILNHEDGSLGLLLGETTPMKNIKRLILKYAPSGSPVLIRGESGTGKDLIAKTIHVLSPRKNGPYIQKNCGAIPESLIESELFGAEKGAFTDAVARPGSFEQAHEGTLFLDELGEMNTASQVRLLRVLEEKEITRLGGRKKIPIDVRIISATNTDLDNAVETGRFRRDLLYRINTLVISVPSLRERVEDIPLIVSSLLENTYKGTKYLQPGAIEKLLNYSWPGNIRELKNVLERAILTADSDTIFGKDVIFYNSRI